MTWLDLPLRLRCRLVQNESRFTPSKMIFAEGLLTMANHVDEHDHTHPHHHDSHSHSHPHSRNHVDPEVSSSRRDFLRVLMGGALAGASVLELAYHRAAWARAAEPTAGGNLFDLQKVADGVYFAHAHPQAMVNWRVAPVSVIVPNQAEGAPGPSLLGTGDTTTIRGLDL
jgi:hypothetical protein